MVRGALVRLATWLGDAGLAGVFWQTPSDPSGTPTVCAKMRSDISRRPYTATAMSDWLTSPRLLLAHLQYMAWQGGCSLDWPAESFLAQGGQSLSHTADRRRQTIVVIAPGVRNTAPNTRYPSKDMGSLVDDRVSLAPCTSFVTSVTRLSRLGRLNLTSTTTRVGRSRRQSSRVESRAWSYAGGHGLPGTVGTAYLTGHCWYGATVYGHGATTTTTVILTWVPHGAH